MVEQRPSERPPAIEEGHGERGQGLVEYALILSLIALLAVAAVLALGGHLTSAYQHAANCLQDPTGC